MEVLHKIENDIHFITINRESALNALNGKVINNLRTIFSEITSEGIKSKGVILTGSGSKAFVAGADISEFVNLRSKEAEELSVTGQKVFDSIERLGIPVIAAINGFALGGGCELAMACHLRIAGEHAKFGQPEVNLGLIPGYGGTQRLTRYIGKTKAMELILTGDMISAQEALNLGLINKICESGKEIEAATELIEKISKKGPNAIARSIQAINAFDSVDDGYQLEAKLFGMLMEQAEAKEGIQAFLEKRKAQFNR